MQVPFRAQKLKWPLWLAALLWIPPSALAERGIVLRHADSVRLIGSGGARTTLWEGDVEAYHEGALLRCDRARVDQRRGHVQATGRVRFTSDEGVLLCDSASYESDERVLRALGRVSWDGDQATILAREMVHWRNRHHSLATGEAQLTLARSWFGGTQQPGESPICVLADSLWWFDGDDEGRHRATGNVTIKLGDMWAEAERADFERERGLLVLVGTPRIIRGSGEVRGRRLIVQLEEGMVAALDAITEARYSEQRGPELHDRVEGDSLRLAFLEGRAEAVDVAGAARALFHPEDDPQTWNLVDGESIHIDLQDERAVAVAVQGSAAGSYGYPRRRGERD